MRSAITFATVSASIGASASVIAPHVLPRDEPKDSGYTFKLVAHGKASGPIGQLFDGQNRVGGGLPRGHYTLKHGPKGGVIVDSNGRGCILTPPTTQFQCDQGVGGTPGFDVNCDKQLVYNGSPEFWACPVDDHGVWNLYTKPNFDQKKCITITLSVESESGHAPPCKQSPPPHKQSCYGDHADCKPIPPPAPCKEECSEGHCKCQLDTPPKPDRKGKVSPDGTCGGNNGFNCHGFVDGSCCSSHGWCGATPVHCGKGCQGEFGDCQMDKNDHTPPSPSPPACEHTKDGKCTPPPPPPPSCKSGKDGKDNKDDCTPVKEHTGCPADLEGPYEFPHLMIPVDSHRPDKAFGNKLNGTISSTMCTVYSFDIHPRFAGKTCSLTFLFPKQEHLETSAYTFMSWGEHAGLIYFELSKPVTFDTTWNTLGEKKLIANGPVHPDLAVGAYDHKCAAGKTKSIMVCGEGVYLDYFQDFNPSPIGLYMRTC